MSKNASFCLWIGLAFLMVHCSQPSSGAGASHGLGGTDFTLWQVGSGPFKYTDHWMSQETGIVLTHYMAPDNLRNFCPNFRGIDPGDLPFSAKAFKRWEIEYFCEPDYTLSLFQKGESQHIYASEIRWDKSVYFDQRRNRMLVTYVYKPANGFLKWGREEKPPNVEMKIEFNWPYASSKVAVVVSIRNLDSTPLDFAFTAQDAAYLWFPNQAQVDLEPFLFEKGMRSEVTHQNHQRVVDLFAGLFSEKHRVFSGFRTIRADLPPKATLRTSVGTAHYYINVPTRIPIGYQLPLPKTPADFDEQIRLALRDDSDLQNRYASFWVNQVGQGQTVNLVFEMVMGLVPAGETLDAYVANVLKQK